MAGYLVVPRFSMNEITPCLFYINASLQGVLLFIFSVFKYVLTTFNGVFIDVFVWLKLVINEEISSEKQIHT